MPITRKKFFQTVKIVLCLYLAYALLTGVLSYLLPAEVNADARKAFDVSLFYGEPESPGVDQALLVESPGDAFVRRMEIIERAERTLDIAYHCLTEGETVDCLLAQVLLAAERGVKVRILLDGKVGMGSHKDGVTALSAHPNIELGLYNRLNLLAPWEWNVLLHDKFILADERYLLMGGRNLGDEYFDPPEYEGAVTNDRDVLIINTAAGAEEAAESVTQSVAAYMDSLWTAPETYIVTEKREPAWGAPRREELKETLASWKREFPDYFRSPYPMEEAAVPTGKVTLVHNPVSTFKKEPLAAYTLYRLFETGDQIQIQTPYATANPRTLHALTEIAEDAQVSLLTNSTASSPNFPAFSTYVTQRNRFLKTGIQIYEYQSRDSIHAKSALMDGDLSVIGSLNLDDRSLYIDTESLLVIHSPEFNQTLSQEFEGLYDMSARVGEDNQYLAADEDKVLKAPLWKTFLMNLASVLTVPFQFLI